MQIETPPSEKPYDKAEGERRGLVIVNTGDGKGKSTAAFGLALRAHGRGKAVKIYDKELRQWLQQGPQRSLAGRYPSLSCWCRRHRTGPRCC